MAGLEGEALELHHPADSVGLCSPLGCLLHVFLFSVSAFRVA